MIKLQAAAVAFGSAFFLKSAVKEASELERSMRGLNSIAANFRVNTANLNETVKELAADGMIPLSDITESFKNLLRSTSGDLDLSRKAFEALRDSAVNNRESQYSLGEAVVQTTRGIRNQNSILSDASGVSKNLSQVNKAYAESIGTTVAKLTDQQKQLGSVIGLTKEAAISQGDYARSLNDFDGIISKIGGEFRRFQQNIGQFITRSPVLLKIFKDIGIEFSQINKDLVDFVNQGGIKQVTLSMLDFANDFTNYVLKPISYIADAVNLAVKGAALGIQVLIELFAQFGGFVGKLFSSFGVDNGVTQFLQDFQASTMAATESMAADLATSFDSAFGTQNLDKVSSFVKSYRAEVSKIPETAKVIADNNKNIVENMKKTSIDLGGIVKGGIVKLMSSAMQELGRILVEGGFSFKTFGAIVINALGDLAIQMGTMIIGASSAMDALKASVAGAGGVGIVYGAALVAIGGAMKAFSGSIGGGAGASGGGSSSFGGISSSTSETFTQDEPVERQDQAPGITVNIKGDVLDSTETGLRVVDIINKAYDQEGVVINRGAIA